MKLKTVLLLSLTCALPALAQSNPAIGNITASGSTCATANACISLQLDGSTGAATIQLTNTFTGTAQFEVSSDNSTTWAAINGTPPNSTTAVSSATSTGVWQFNVAGFTNIRVRASALASGTISVVINSARVSAKSSGGGTSLPDITDVAGVSVTIGNSAQFLAQTGSGTAPGISFVGNLTTGLVASGGNLYLATPAANVNFNNGANVNATLSTGTGLFIGYGGGVAVTGQGLTSIRGATSQKSETTTADANVLTLTPPAAAGTYRVSVVISVSSATSGIISWTLSYTDSNGNAQANIAMPLFQFGTAAPNTTFTASAAGNYTGTSTIDINNAAAAIVVKWVGGGTTAAKMSATIERIQ